MAARARAAAGSLGRRRTTEEREKHDLSIRMRPVAVRQFASTVARIRHPVGDSVSSELADRNGRTKLSVPSRSLPFPGAFRCRAFRKILR